MKNMLLILSLICFSLQSIYSQNTISGKVLESKTKNAIEGVNVYLPDLHRVAVTDSSGEFKIEDVSSGRFDIFFSYLSYKNELIRVQTDSLTKPIIVFLEPEIFQSEEIIISGNRFTLQHENAISVESKKISVSSNHINLMKQIAEVPGVDMISKGGGVVKPVIRGLSNTNIIFIDNGVRMENFQFSDNHPFMVDEFGIDRIEVIKGPASLLYGSDAVGGVLFAIREKPPHGNKFKGDYSLQYFDNTKGINSSFGIQKSYNKLHIGVRASLKSHKDYTDGAGMQVPNTRFNQKSIKAVLGYSHKKGNFDLYYDFSEMQLGMCIPPSIKLVKSNTYKNEVWYQKLNNHIVSVKNKLFFNKLKLDINANFQSNNRTFLTSTDMPVFKTVDMLLNTFNSEIKSTYSLSKAEIIFGLQTMYQKNSNSDAPVHVIPDAEIFDFSVFSMMSKNFTDKIHFQAGLRYDFRNIKTIIEKQYPSLSFSTGVTFQLTKKMLLRANFASAHRTPNLAELTQDGMHGAYYERGNQNLKTQVNFEPDIALHYHLKKFLFEVSAFRNQINNYIFLNRTSQDTDTGVPIYEYSQTNSIILGLETGLKFMPFNFMKFSVNYSFLDAKQENGEYLPFIPQNKINSNLEIFSKKMFFVEKPFLSISTNYAFEQNKPAEFETETPKYFLTNISMGFEKKIKRQSIIFSVGVNNLFNTKYYDHLSTLKSLNYYQMGRNLFINLKFKF